MYGKNSADFSRILSESIPVSPDVYAREAFFSISVNVFLSNLPLEELHSAILNSNLLYAFLKFPMHLQNMLGMYIPAQYYHFLKI